MPLDGRNWKPETETKPDLSRPSLEGLSWLLRHLPEDHEWNYCHVGGRRENGCGFNGCAIGLGAAFWGVKEFFVSYEDFAPKDVLEGMFLEGLSSYGVLHSQVTPQMVAQKIDAYLAETRK